MAPLEASSSAFQYRIIEFGIKESIRFVARPSLSRILEMFQTLSVKDADGNFLGFMTSRLDLGGP
jgi:hypothetical protein